MIPKNKQLAMMLAFSATRMPKMDCEILSKSGSGTGGTYGSRVFMKPNVKLRGARPEMMNRPHCGRAPVERLVRHLFNPVSIFLRVGLDALGLGSMFCKQGISTRIAGFEAGM